MEERIQKIMARCGHGSRRDCEELIAAGRVKVNGEKAILGTKADAAVDTITVDGRALSKEEPDRLYIALNKPRNVLSDSDPDDPRTCVRDLIPVPGHLFTVGRLDFESEGLILMTNDGELANRLTHPRYGHEKEYRVLLAATPDDEQLKTWRRGVVLEDGERTLPADIQIESKLGKGAWVRVIMREGRKRQIREVGKRIGLPVVRIVRVRIGTLRLGTLKPREWRYLTSEEVNTLQSLQTPSESTASSEGHKRAERNSDRWSRQSSASSRPRTANSDRPYPSRSRRPSESPSPDHSDRKPYSSERPSSDHSNRKPYSSERPASNYSERKPYSSERPVSDHSDRKPYSSERPVSDHSDRKPYSSERPSSGYSDRKPYSSERPSSDHSGRKPYSSERPSSDRSGRKPYSSERPASSHSDRKPYSSERPSSGYSDRKPYSSERPSSEHSDRKPYSSERPSSEHSGRKPYSSERPSSGYSARKPYSSGRPSSDHSDRKPYSSERPSSDHSDRKPYSPGRPSSEHSDRKPYSSERPSSSRFDRKPYSSEGPSTDHSDRKPYETGSHTVQDGRPWKKKTPGFGRSPQSGNKHDSARTGRKPTARPTRKTGK